MLRSGLFGTLLQDAETAAQFSSDAMLARMLAFERAWTVALRETGLVDGGAAQSALAAIDDFHVPVLSITQQTDRDGLPVPALIAALRAQAGDGAADAIHTGTTSQDVIDTAMVLTLSDVLDALCARLDRLDQVLDGLSARFGSNSMIGRTRMQAAREIKVADRIRSWRRPLAAARAEATQIRKHLRCVQYGGAVGTRDGVQGQGAEITRVLGRELDLAGDVPCWHSDRHAFIDFGHWLAKLGTACGKFGQDVALMAQQGIDEIQLSGTGGSSAMAHKRNPVRAELVVALGRYIATQQGLLLQAQIHEQERSGTAWALEWLTLPAMSEAAGAVLRASVDLADQVTWIGTPE